ncbi:MAG: hypothetical protein AAF975_04875, partial [Spirochaetota bacterium]
MIQVKVNPENENASYFSFSELKITTNHLVADVKPPPETDNAESPNNRTVPEKPEELEEVQTKKIVPAVHDENGDPISNDDTGNTQSDCKGYEIVKVSKVGDRNKQGGAYRFIPGVCAEFTEPTEVVEHDLNEEAPVAKILDMKITPSAYGKGHFYFSNSKIGTGASLFTEAEAKGRTYFEANYNGIAGIKAEIEGGINKAQSNALSTHLGLGDNAYVYAHILQAFAPLFPIDKKIFDIYLQLGRFNVAFDNAPRHSVPQSNERSSDPNTWLADVDELDRDQKVNMQLDLKIMDMLSIRYGIGFANIDIAKYDMGWALLFSKRFGYHKIEASAAYIVDLSRKPYRKGGGTNMSPYQYTPVYFDQLGFSFAYSRTLGNTIFMPFVNLRFTGLFIKTNTEFVRSFIHPLIGWNTGLKFQWRDTAKNFDLIGASINFGGQARLNNDYTVPGDITQPYLGHDALKDFSLNFSLQVWSDALRIIMGSRYLHAWARLRFDFDDPVVKVNGVDILSRKGFIHSFALGLEQYIVNTVDAKIKLNAGLGMENIAPYYVKGLKNVEPYYVNN